MTQSQQPVTSSPESQNHVKKKSYISKIFGGRKKSRERKEEKRRLASLSSPGSDAVDQNGSPESVENKKKQKKTRSRSCDNEIESPNKSKEKKRGFFKKWGGKKKNDINIVSVELSNPSSESSPDLISPQARHGSISTKISERKRPQKVKSDSNNNNDGKPLNHVIKNVKENSKVVTSSQYNDTKREFNTKPECRPDGPVQYDSATVGRKPIRRKQSAVTDNDWNGFSRSRSFSVKTSNHQPKAKKATKDKDNGNDLQASKYAKMCRQSNQVLDMYTKDKTHQNKIGFLKWHSVGDIQRQIANEKSPNKEFKEHASNIPPPLPAKKKHLNSKTSKSVSLQDLTFQDICNEKTQPLSVYERISRKCSRSTSNGYVYANENDRDAKPRPPGLSHLKPHKMRPSLNKALSKSEANIWPSRREQRIPKATVSPRMNHVDPYSPKRHSADVLEMRSSQHFNHVKSHSDANGMFFQYNMTGESFGENYPDGGDFLYNHTSPADPSIQYKLPHVSSHTDSLLRSSKSTGTLLGHNTTDGDISWAKTPSVGKSVYEQRAPMPDYTQDVEFLLCKLRSSLRDKVPPRPPKSNEVQYTSDRGRSVDVYYPNQRHDAEVPAQFRGVSSSPHRALPTQSEQRGNGVSRSRSRARSIARRFNFSGSTENLSTTTSLVLCKSSNWSTELDGNDEDASEGYCKMKALIPTTPPSSAHEVKRRHCSRPETTNDYVYLSPPNCENIPPINCTSNGNVKMRYKHDKPSYTNSNSYPNVGGTFYYGRRPVSTSYAEKTPMHYQYNYRPQAPVAYHRNTSSEIVPTNNTTKRTKVFYALDV